MNLTTNRAETHASLATGMLRTGSRFQFGDWLVKPSENRLSREGRSIRLEPKIMHLLVEMVRHHDRPCSRTELLDKFWPSLETGESSLTRAISELRKALGDRRDSPQYIGTIQRIGYKAIAPIQFLPVQDLKNDDHRTKIKPEAEVAAMAQYLIVRRNGPDVRRAIRILQENLQQHPLHAEHWALLAYAKLVMHYYSAEPATIHLGQAQKHARHALELDPASGLAWAVLGTLAHLDWNWDESLSLFQRAHNLEPDDQVILHHYAELSLHLGRVHTAQDLMSRAGQLEPLAASAHLVLGWMLLHGEEQRAQTELRKARRLGADSVHADNLECLLLHRAGWDEASLQRWEEINQERQGNSIWMWPKYQLDALLDQSLISRLTGNIRERVQLGYLEAGVAPFMLASAGAVDAAHELSLRTLENRGFFLVDPWLEEMTEFRADPRFARLLESVGMAHLVP